MPEDRRGQFGLRVARWTEKAKGNADQVLRAVCIGLLNNVVVRSPVGNPDLWKNPPPPGYVGGRFRANWQVSVAEPPQGARDAIDPSGQVSIVAGQAVIAGVRCGPLVYIVNNLPYSIELEYGHSTQAPAGMVRLATLEYESVVDSAVRNLNQTGSDGLSPNGGTAK
jgi:hypothetical protein